MLSMILKKLIGVIRLSTDRPNNDVEAEENDLIKQSPILR